MMAAVTSGAVTKERAPFITPARVAPRGTADSVFNNYLTDLDPRGDSDRSEALRFALAASPDKRFPTFLNLLSQRRCAKWSLAAIARQCDLTLAEFQAFWKCAQLDRSLTKACDATPDLTDDLIKDARSVELTCHECDGGGKVAGKDGKLHVCRGCAGRGKIRQIGDRHSRDKLLEMTGLTGKRGTLAQFNASSNTSIVMQELREKMSKIPFDLDLEAETISGHIDGSDPAPKVNPVLDGPTTLLLAEPGSKSNREHH